MQSKTIFTIMERMDISDGENYLGSDFPVPITVPECPMIGEIGRDKVAPCDGKNNNNTADNTEEGNTGESTPGVVQRPNIESLCVCIPRRNAPSSSTQSINFPEWMQFIVMHEDAENQMELRGYEGREEMEDRHHH